MNKGYLAGGVALVALAVGLFLIVTCTYTIDEREQAVITRFNEPIRVIVGHMPGTDLEERKAEIRASVLQAEDEDMGPIEVPDEGVRVSEGAGLYFKMPFTDEVHRLPNVILDYDADPEEMTLAEKNVSIDTFARWQVENPLLFFMRVRTEAGARARLDDLIYSEVRGEVGQYDLNEVVRTTNRFLDRRPAILDEFGDEVEAFIDEEEYYDNPLHERIERGREEIMTIVTELVDERARDIGVRVIDVRVKRAELLEENLEAVFERMRAERSRISMGYRSEGERQSEIIRGTTDRQVQVIVANAERDAEILRGEGDAQAVALFAEAFESDPGLYTFMRSLDIMREATPAGTEFVVGLDSSIFHLLRNNVGAEAETPPPNLLQFGQE